jgi:hypothetical protein
MFCTPCTEKPLYYNRMVDKKVENYKNFITRASN